MTKPRRNCRVCGKPSYGKECRECFSGSKFGLTKSNNYKRYYKKQQKRKLLS